MPALPDMPNLDQINALISTLALGGSLWAVILTLRMRKVDSFGKLYEQFNTTEFGAAMEQIANWTRSILPRSRDEKPVPASPRQIYDAYWAYLDAIPGPNTKDDALEKARRMVKSWCVKSFDYRDCGDLSANQLHTLITPDRMKLMLMVANMTRAQAARWKKAAGESTLTSSDEPKFVRLEAMARRHEYTSTR